MSEHTGPAEPGRLDLPTTALPVVPPRPLRIQLLGGFRVTLGDQVVADDAWRLRKAKSLVKLLALATEHTLHREELMELLWPDREPEAAANNLRYTLHVARRAMHSAASGTPHFLQMQGERLALAPATAVWVDVEAFETASTAAWRTAEPAAYAAALELYIGDLLPEDRYEDWATGRREALRTTWLALLADIAQLHEARLEYPRAIGALERVVAAEPTHEPAHVGLMRLYALAGQRSRALQQYQQLQDALRRELDAEPDLASRQLYADIHADRFPAAASRPGAGVLPAPAPPRHNLPLPVTSFIGREQELATLKTLLGTTRLLTLTGAGGCGKTRLTLAVATDLVAAYPDGVWLVELAALADPALVPAAVAAALGVREEAGRTLREALVDALAAKRLLLVMDNCEHLIDAVAELIATLLVRGSRLQVLATSREALRTPGEMTWSVPSLAVPEAGQSASLETLRGVAAVGLLLDRVRLRRPDFILTPDNAPAVIEICRRLDGLPLAIELAAARTAVLTVEQIADHLSDALRVLAGGSRTALPRQQTLRAALDWSYALLDPREQTVFNRLGVFAGSWTLEAAEAVAAGPDIDEREVLDLLSRLVDKSLVQVDGWPGEVRYRLLETIRQYALEQLSAREEEERSRRQHVAYYLALAERARIELERAQQVEWFEHLEREHDNLRAALGWSLDRGELETVVRLGWALVLFWYTRGHFSEGRRWMEAPLKETSALRATLRAMALCIAAALAFGQGDIRAVSSLSEECLALANAADDRFLKAHMLFFLGRVAMFHLKYERATELLEESLGLFRHLGDSWGTTLMLDNLGQIPLAQGDYAQATQIFEECLSLARAAGNTTHIAQSLSNLGWAAQRQGDYRRALRLLEESLSLSRELGYTLIIAAALQRIGRVTLLQGDSERAIATLEESLSMSREGGNTRYTAAALYALAMAVLLQGDHRRAGTLLEEGLALARGVGDLEIITHCIEGLAAVAVSQGKADGAAPLWGAAAGLRAEAGAPRERADDLCEHYRSAARANLEEEAWTAAWAAGHAMTLDQAAASALAVVEPTPTTLSEDPAHSQQPIMLTQREREVATLIARGLTNQQIATELCIAPRTADTHVSHILHKLVLASRAQVVEWVADCGSLT